MRPLETQEQVPRNVCLVDLKLFALLASNRLADLAIRAKLVQDCGILLELVPNGLRFGQLLVRVLLQ